MSEDISRSASLIDREMQRYRDAKDKAAAAIEVYNEYTEADATFSEAEWESWNREFEENATKASDKISKVVLATCGTLPVSRCVSLTACVSMSHCLCHTA